jgi:hypothetical protein
MYREKTNKKKEAIEALAKAAEFGGNNPEVQYNLGLLYLKLGREQDALRHGQAAYTLGYPLPGLKNQLVQRGVWRDPE